MVELNVLLIFKWYSSSFHSFSSEGEPSELSRHIRGVVEVEGSREQNGLLKIKAELDTYQKQYGREYNNREHFSMKKRHSISKEENLKRSLEKFQKRNNMKRRQTQPALCLENVFEHPEILLHRAKTVNGMKRSKTAPITTSRLGQLVEQNARRDSLFF